MRLAGGLAMGAALAACGLSVVGQPQADADADAGADAGAASAEASSEATVEASQNDAAHGDADATADGADAAEMDAAEADVVDAAEAGPSCDVLIDDHFATLSSSWVLAGDSPALDAPGQLVMTHGQTETAALWWKTKLQYTGTLRAAMTYTTTGGVSPTGEGMTIAWQNNADFRAGGASNGSGLCGAGMFGVAVSARFSNQLDVLKSFDNNCGFTDEVNFIMPPSGALGFTGRPASLRATLVSGSTTITTVSSVPTAASGYLGFTASSAGGSSRRTIITAVLAESCP